MNTSKQHFKPYTRINRKCIPIHKIPKESYHIIFNNRIGYSKCCEIITALVDLNILESAYRIVRAKRGDMTIRVSPAILRTGTKKAPTPWRMMPSPYYGKQCGMIKQYMTFINAVNNLFKEVI